MCENKTDPVYTRPFTTKFKEALLARKPSNLKINLKELGYEQKNTLFVKENKFLHTKSPKHVLDRFNTCVLHPKQDLVHFVPDKVYVREYCNGPTKEIQPCGFPLFSSTKELVGYSADIKDISFCFDAFTKTWSLMEEVNLKKENIDFYIEPELLLKEAQRYSKANPNPFWDKTLLLSRLMSLAPNDEIYQQIRSLLKT